MMPMKTDKPHDAAKIPSAQVPTFERRGSTLRRKALQRLRKPDVAKPFGEGIRLPEGDEYEYNVGKHENEGIRSEAVSTLHRKTDNEPSSEQEAHAGIRAPLNVMSSACLSVPANSRCEMSLVLVRRSLNSRQRALYMNSPWQRRMSQMIVRVPRGINCE